MINNKKWMLRGFTCFTLAVSIAAFPFVKTVSAKAGMDRSKTETETAVFHNTEVQVENSKNNLAVKQITTGEITTGSTPDTNTSYTTNEVIVQSPIVETWVPVTAEEKQYYSYVGKEKLAFTSNSTEKIKIANSVQGIACQKAFASVLEDYTMVRTYNIFPGDANLNHPVYEADKEVQITMEIPKALQKEGRTFRMICVTTNGVPVLLDNLGNDSSAITIQTKYFYAYALCYKDK